MTRFFIAKNKFTELLRPLDIKTIIESYKYGQMDVMSRVSHMQTTIDTIYTRVGLNENLIQNSQNLLNQRIERIESFVNEIESKLEKQNNLLNKFSSNPIFDDRFYHKLNNIFKEIKAKRRNDYKRESF